MVYMKFVERRATAMTLPEVMICKTFYENGNASWHYDRALNAVGERIDYRVASYVEDMR